MAVVIRLDRDLVPFSGPMALVKPVSPKQSNGYFTVTKRRLLGESYSKAEYAGTYANAHAASPCRSTQGLIAGREYLLTGA